MPDPEPAEDDPKHIARLRYALYVETLRARMAQPQFDAVLSIIHQYVRSSDGMVRIKRDDPEYELFTEEVQQEVLTLMGLIRAMKPGCEETADHVVARLGDGEFAKGAMSLVPREVADDPDRLRAMRDNLDAQQRRRSDDRATVEGIARASGMDDTSPDDGP